MLNRHDTPKKRMLGTVVNLIDAYMGEGQPHYDCKSKAHRDGADDCRSCRAEAKALRVIQRELFRRSQVPSDA